MDELQPPDRESQSPNRQSRNQMSASRVEGSAVQTGPVSGNVIIQSSQGESSGSRLVPWQLPCRTSSFTDHQPYLLRLHRVFAAEPGDRQRLALITGEGGIGKTALVIEWAHGVSERFKDGILFCDLRGSHNGAPADPAVVAGGLLEALGVNPARIPVDLDLRSAELRTVLAARKVLIVLDNAASAAQVRPLLPGDGGSAVIVTSRKQLMRLGEYGVQRIRLDVFELNDAVDLLREVMMAGGRQGDDEEELAELARLCARLPLALRIAAERAIAQPDMPLGDLLEDLRDHATSLDALSTDEGNAVRAVFSWAYGQLTPDEARVFRLLGLHGGLEISHGGLEVGLGAAAAAAGLQKRRARRALDALTEAHLLESAGRHRYRQHNLLRAFARDQAEATDTASDRRDAVDRVARWYTVTAHNASEALVPGRAFELDTTALAAGLEPERFETEDAAYQWFTAERPNLVAAARSAYDAGLWRRTWELAMVLSPLQATYFTFDDWSALSELSLTAAGQVDDPVALASALDNRGRFLLRWGEPREAEAAHARALELQETAHDEPGVCRSLNALGLVRLQVRDLPAAIDYLERARRRSADTGQPQWRDRAAANLAHARLESGEPEEALAILEPLPELFAGRRDLLNVGTSLQLMAWARRLGGDHGAARDAIGRAVQIAVDSRKPVWEANWRMEAARVALELKDTAEAARHSERALSLQREVGDLGREAAALDCEGEVLLATGNAEGASGCHRDAVRMHRERGEAWQEAVALAHLADSEAALDHPEAAREAAARAQPVIDRFTDARAAKISANLRRYLA